MDENQTYKEALEMVSKKIRTYETVSEKLRDNPAFVLEVLTMNREKKEVQENGEINIFIRMQEDDIIYYSSDRIQKMCEDKDPVKALESVIQKEQLEKELTHKAPEPVKRKVLKL